MRARENRKFKLVIFDMDGVITDTMPYHFDAWLATMARAGVRVNCYDVYKREGQDGLTSIKEFFRHYNVPLDPAVARRILSQKERLFKRIVRKKFVKGSRPFVRMLKRRNYLLALVTGTARHEVRRVMPSDLLGQFDAIITGNDVTRGKPHPEPFLKALKALGIPARDAAVIENAPFGIKAAKLSGLYCIAIQTSLPKRYLRGADAVYRSFKDIKNARIF